MLTFICGSHYGLGGAWNREAHVAGRHGCTCRHVPVGGGLGRGMAIQCLVKGLEDMRWSLWRRTPGFGGYCPEICGGGRGDSKSEGGISCPVPYPAHMGEPTIQHTTIGDCFLRTHRRRGWLRGGGRINTDKLLAAEISTTLPFLHYKQATNIQA